MSVFTCYPHNYKMYMFQNRVKGVNPYDLRHVLIKHSREGFEAKLPALEGEMG